MLPRGCRRWVKPLLALAIGSYILNLAAFVNFETGFGFRSPALTHNEKDFYLNGAKTKLYSGAVHYFRVPKAYWYDRLMKLKAAGLNGVETYVPWNLHEADPGVFDFAGDLDLVSFLQLANQLDLFVLLRPGPYICSEWDWGGLPSWLLQDSFMKVRTQYKGYQTAVRNYFQVLIPKILPLQSSMGGPIIAVQVENEYAFYGNQDPGHLEWLKSLLFSLGVVEPLFTSDSASAFEKPTSVILRNELRSINFKNAPSENVALFHQYAPHQPLWVMEFWAGWFDWWGEGRNLFNDEQFADNLNVLLKSNANINFYMFHGGTNFGFTSGALKIARGYYTADVTSYDYDCPIAESGALGPKYHMIRQAIARHTNVPPPPLYKSTILPPWSYHMIEPSGFISLFKSMERAESVLVPDPVPMEIIAIRNGSRIGQNFGYAFYQNKMSCEALDDQNEQIVIRGLKTKLKGRAHFFHDEMSIGKPILLEDEASTQEDTLKFSTGRSEFMLGILVENPGRVNFENRLGNSLDAEYKGITGHLSLTVQTPSGYKPGCQWSAEWKIVSLPLLPPFIRALEFDGYGDTGWPGFYRFEMNIRRAPRDTFIDPIGSGFVKGCIFVNGRNLGRYWSIGPQRTLFLPGPWLHAGRNQIVVFEEFKIRNKDDIRLHFKSEPDLGQRSTRPE